MFHRHQHHWEEVSRKFNPPWERSLKANWVSEDMMRQLMMGVTVIELRCTECGDIKHKEVIGEV